MPKFKLGKVLTGGMKHALGVPLDASEKHETRNFKEATGSSNAAAEQQAAQVIAAEQARHQAEAAKAQAEANQQTAMQREAAAKAQHEASSAEAAALQAQLDAALQAKRVADLKLQLAEIKLLSSPQPAEVEQKSAQKKLEEDDPVLDVAVAESLSASAQPASAAAASLPPSYDEATNLAIAASLAELSNAPSAAAGVSSLTIEEEKDKNLDEGLALSKAGLLPEQIKTLVDNLIQAKTSAASVKLTQEQFNAL